MTRALFRLSLIFCLSIFLTMESYGGDLRTQHRGIQISAMELPPEGTFDFELLPPDEAIKKLKTALDLIYTKSTFSSRAIDKLKKAGHVEIVYDPLFPKEKFSSVTLAAFLPDYYQPEGNLKQFLVIVGRYGINWPVDKLGALVTHELGGHGYQHLKGRTLKDRKLDRECEAQLYEEAAYQDLEVKRDTEDMIRFRSQMQKNWCGDFRAYMRKIEPETIALWNHGTPKIAELLPVFERYLVHLQNTGVSGKAVAAVKEKRQADLKQREQAAYTSRSGPDLFDVGMTHLMGLGTKQDQKLGYKWIDMASKAGHPPAMVVIGEFWEKGLGGRQVLENAYFWYALAANRGEKLGLKLQKNLDKVLPQKTRTNILEKASKWRPTGAPS